MPVEEPRASWLELFYDLLYVANLSEFTHSHPITDGQSLMTYVGWFVILWWTWAGQTFWAARYDMDDLFSRGLKLVEFWALISFGSFSSDHLHHTVHGFIISYCIQKCVLMVEYGNVLYWARRNQSTQSVLPLILHIITNFSAVVIWSLSSLVHDASWRSVMWYSSIVFEIVVLVIFGRRSSVTFAGSHLPERFALFTILVLGEVFRETTQLSQLWAYIHLPLHICMVLVGTGALDLIRLYQLEHNIKEIPHSPDDVNASHLSQLLATKSLYLANRDIAGVELPFLRTLASRSGTNPYAALMASGAQETDFDLTKQYFMAAGGAVFLCNALLKWINLRKSDKFQKIVYCARFFVALVVFTLMMVPSELLTPYALLGMMAGFGFIQVAVDLTVIYFGAYGFFEDEIWTLSARSSLEPGSMMSLPAGSSSAPHDGSHVGSGIVQGASAGLKEHIPAKSSFVSSGHDHPKPPLAHHSSSHHSANSSNNSIPNSNYFSRQREESDDKPNGSSDNIDHKNRKDGKDDDESVVHNKSTDQIFNSIDSKNSTDSIGNIISSHNGADRINNDYTKNDTSLVTATTTTTSEQLVNPSSANGFATHPLGTSALPTNHRYHDRLSNIPGTVGSGLNAISEEEEDEE
ncbi:hypothetical protein DFQ27_003305 [Actinomortierella ambigua]|uniref:Low temperature requirement A n=1 Tax=Actinomortierella ambigua TaxID=1343610 RepID=A0A9P6Q681_9FUNG|nr:hypothetical protein DFQ27_003305 [Actinomortierella ambigua]